MSLICPLSLTPPPLHRSQGRVYPYVSFDAFITEIEKISATVGVGCGAALRLWATGRLTIACLALMAAQLLGTLNPAPAPHFTGAYLKIWVHPSLYCTFIFHVNRTL